jgi:MraZ protein
MIIAARVFQIIETGIYMFIGQTQSTLNKEGRMVLPPQYQQAIQAGAYLTVGFDRNLLLLSANSFQNILGYIRSLSITDPLTRLFVRLFLGNAVQLSLDEKEQVVIPSNLLEYAGIDGEIVIVGQGDFCEVWAPDLWKQQDIAVFDHKANVDRFSNLHIAIV